MITLPELRKVLERIEREYGELPDLKVVVRAPAADKDCWLSEDGIAVEQHKDFGVVLKLIGGIGA